MEKINQLLENWKEISKTNKVLEKDYSILNNRVLMTIHLFKQLKTIYADCKSDLQEIQKAIEELEQKKDELI